MKRVSALLVCLLTFAVVLPAQADGRGHGGDGRHGGHGYGSHYRGSSNHWLAPVLGAALVGSVIYAASTPSYAMPQQVVVQQQYVPPSRVAYFCPTSQQFYPNVPTCQVPWQLTNN
jgi:protein-S-isoprenylcysteine O-methyltransferase Ste14